MKLQGNHIPKIEAQTTEPFFRRLVHAIKSNGRLDRVAISAPFYAIEDYAKQARYWTCSLKYLFSADACSAESRSAQNFRHERINR